MVNDKLLRSAIASKIAYARSNRIVRQLPISKQLVGSECVIDKIIDVPRTGCHVYVWRSGTHSKMFAFRGSHNLSDILRVIDTKQEKFHFREASFHVHKGVYEMFQSIEGDLSKELFPHDRQIKHVTFCGHSLGGALAAFASGYYSHLTHGNLKITCHTFGAPIVGDYECSKWIHDSIDESINVKMHTDIVPWVQSLFDPRYKPFEERDLLINRSLMDPFIAHDLDTYIAQISSQARAASSMKDDKK